MQHGRDSCYMSRMRDRWKQRFMKLDPYPVLLTTGALMMAIVVFAQINPPAWLLKAKVAAADTPATDEAKHPETRLASLDREPAERGGGGRTLED
jgi:hypothetical protein